jgi:hypothetical protein
MSVVQGISDAPIQGDGWTTVPAGGPAGRPIRCAAFWQAWCARSSRAPDQLEADHVRSPPDCVRRCVGSVGVVGQDPTLVHGPCQVFVHCAENDASRRFRRPCRGPTVSA